MPTPEEHRIWAVAMWGRFPDTAEGMTTACWEGRHGDCGGWVSLYATKKPCVCPHHHPFANQEVR